MRSSKLQSIHEKKKVHGPKSSYLMVKKRSGRLEPFDGVKMARMVSRAGIPYAIALGIAKTIKNDKSLMEKDQVSSVALRRMVVEEMVRLGEDTAAKSYIGYKKTQTTKENFRRSHRHRPKVHKQTRTHAKQSAKDKHNTSGRPPRW